MDDDTYTVREDNGLVEVCVEIGSVPSGGLEEELLVTLTILPGTKTGNYAYEKLNKIKALCTVCGTLPIMCSISQMKT